MEPTDELNQMIAEYRVATIARRARAFIDCPDYVLGLELLPLTPKTWTMLSASGSRFLAGGQPMEGDIRNYLWFHSRLFTLRPWLAPVMKWLALLRFNATLHRKRDIDWYCATVALAAASIYGVIEEALADAAKGGGGAPGPCLEAQLIHLCAKEYGWLPERTQATPLRHLFQLVRCINPEETEEGERQVRFDFLKKKQAEAEKAHAL